MSVSLLDIREGRKVSADFHVDLNHEVVRQMLSSSGNAGDQALDGGNAAPQENGLTSPVEKKTEDCQLSTELENWLRFPKQVEMQEPFDMEVYFHSHGIDLCSCVYVVYMVDHSCRRSFQLRIRTQTL